MSKIEEEILIFRGGWDEINWKAIVKIDWIFRGINKRIRIDILNIGRQFSGKTNRIPQKF